MYLFLLENCSHGFACLDAPWDPHDGNLWSEDSYYKSAGFQIDSYPHFKSKVQKSRDDGATDPLERTTMLNRPFVSYAVLWNKPDKELAKASPSTPQAHPRFQTWVMARQLRITDLQTTQTGTRNRQKSFVDVAVLASHVTQFSFPKANVLIANWK